MGETKTENLVLKQSRFKKPKQSTSYFEQTFISDTNFDDGQVAEENGKPVLLSTVVQPVLVTTEYEINRTSPTQTFDAFEYTGPSAVTTFFKTAAQSSSTTFEIEKSAQTVLKGRSVELPEFIGTLGSSQPMKACTSILDPEGKSAWNETRWNEKQTDKKSPDVKSLREPDVQVLGFNVTGPAIEIPSTKSEMVNEDKFHGSFGGNPKQNTICHEEKQWDLVKESQMSFASSTVLQSSKDDAQGMTKEHKRGRLQKEYSVKSESEELFEAGKYAERNLKEYSVVSESEEIDKKDKKNSISVLSLEKNEEITSIKPLPKSDLQLEIPSEASSVPSLSADQVSEQQVYSRKKKKGKKSPEVSIEEKEQSTVTEDNNVGEIVSIKSVPPNLDEKPRDIGESITLTEELTNKKE